ncbi:winged helix-turn-helix domain-containing protein, partial [Mesorhizobium sp. M8A.F.Ca.ET.181.01.1.1]|uniref:winged helix-turn-helix domain-containing protein n=1 Tax=Mesorhizobium sp. M8A.F.Ca.ET.181.01.1.1 TaxID=2563963 RepID=UPI001FE0F851
PDTIVEENNIQVHLSALRKILGADRDLILTVPGRGYRLVPRQRTTANAAAGHLLPPQRMQLVGRDAAVAVIEVADPQAILAQRRLDARARQQSHLASGERKTA